MKKKTTDEDIALIRRIAQIGIWKIVREYQQCLREIEYYAKAYVREYLSESTFCSCSYEDDTEIAIVYKHDNEEHCTIVELEELVLEGLKNTYLC